MCFLSSREEIYAQLYLMKLTPGLCLFVRKSLISSSNNNFGNFFFKVTPSKRTVTSSVTSFVTSAPGSCLGRLDRASRRRRRPTTTATARRRCRRSTATPPTTWRYLWRPSMEASHRLRSECERVTSRVTQTFKLQNFCSIQRVTRDQKNPEKLDLNRIVLSNEKRSKSLNKV